MLKIIAEYQNSQNIQNIAGYKTVFIAKQPIIKLLLKIIDPAGLLSYIAQQMNIKIIGFITILINKLVSAVSNIAIILQQHFHKQMTFELLPDARAAKPICHVSVCSG